MSINMQQLQPTQLYGVTGDMIQAIYEKAVKELRVRMFFLDASYMYTFHLDDFEYVKKFNKLGRYDPLANVAWHGYLERWYQDQTVTIGDRTFQPVQIVRCLDRVVNQGLEQLAGAICGQVSVSAFDCRGLGDATIDEPSISDTAQNIGTLVDIINVNETDEGGSLSRDGTTIYSVGNHHKDTPTPDNNEFTHCVMLDDLTLIKAKLLDNSVFEDPLEHIQGVDAPGSTTVIYMCSG